MPENLNDLLFKRKVIHKGGSEKKVLFHFQSELAVAIVNSAPNYRGKDPSNIRPYVNQVLKSGSEHYQKPISVDLRNGMILAIKSRLAQEDPLFNNLEKAFDEAYELLKKIPDEKESSKFDTEWDELLAWQAISNKTSVFNRLPSEAKWCQDKSDDETKDLLNTTISNIFENYKQPRKDILEFACNYTETKQLEQLVQSEQSEQTKGARQQKKREQPKGPKQKESPYLKYGYRFYVPNLSIVKDLWQGIFEFTLREIFKPEYPMKSLNELIDPTIRLINWFNTSEPFKFIRVFTADASIVSVPLVYFECKNGLDNLGRLEYESLFSLILKKKKLNSVSKITGDDMEFWKEKVFYPVKWSEPQSKAFNITEVTFEKVCVHIIRTLNQQRLME
ncbi:MAG: hypothetical protein WCO63_02970 [Bacteroidota bacterium]